MAETLATLGRLVKVYVLNGAGKWDDRGTGHVCVENDPDTKAVMIKVTSDATGRISLASAIRPTHEALYQTQEDNIISWNEEIPGGVPTEVALSFQEPEGCRELWEKICQVDAELKRASALGTNAARNRTTLRTNAQAGGNETSPNALGTYALSNEVNTTSAAPDNLHNQSAPTAGVSLVDSTAPEGAHSRLFDDNLEGSAWGNADAIDDVVFPDTANVLFLGNSPASFAPTLGTEVTSPTAFVMPDPDRVGIAKLARVMSDQAMISMRAVREEIIAKVLTSDYITKVCHLFRKAERDGDLDCLSMLYHVIRCLFVIGSNGVLEVLVCENHLMDVVGCLEYDQEHIPELEKQAIEWKRKESARKANTGTSPVSQTMVPKTDSSSSRPSKDLSRVENPNDKLEESSCEFQNADPSSPSQQPPVMEIEQPKGVAPGGDEQNAFETENYSKPDKAKEGKISPVEKSLATSAANSTSAACNLSNRHSERNNSEETSSSGNMPDGDTPRFSLRTHRDYLERKVSYRSVVPITDRHVVAKIHQNYRVAYIRDVILSRVFDEGMSNMLSGVILCNNLDIMMYFISESNALRELFTRLKASVRSRRQMREATISSGDVPSDVSPEKKIDAAKNASSPATPRYSAIASTLGAKNMSDSQLDELGGSSAKPGHQKETSSSSGRGGSPFSNPISLTTADTCPTTDPNALTSADQSSRGVADKGKTPLDTTSREPKSSEQSEELNEDLRNMLGLLRELCQVVKGLQPLVQVRFHQILLEFGALEISVGLLLDEDRVLRSLCCDILSSAIYHDQGEVRAHIMKNATQQHSSVPMEQISSRNVVHGSRLIEGTAIVTETKSTGVTAEVAVDERHQAMTAHQATNSVDVFEQELPKGDDTERLQDMGRTLAAGSKDGFKPSVSPHGDVTTATLVMSNGSDSNTCDEQATSLNNAFTPVSTSPNTNQNKEEVGRNPSAPFDSEATRDEKHSRVDTDLPLLSAMIEVICQDKESGVALTVLDLLRTLLDPLTMKPPILDKSMFLKAFYEKFVSRLMVPIELASHPDRREPKDQNVSDENVSHICDLLSFCVKNHSFKSKYFVLGRDVGRKVVELLDHKKAHVRLAGVRFIRTCVDRREGMYDRYILEKNLIDPIMSMYARNQYKDNLTSSAVLELVSFLTSKRRVLLLRHVIKEYEATLQPGTSTCRVLEEAKRTLEKINQECATPPQRNQTKDSDNVAALQAGAEAGISNEQRSLLDKNDSLDTSKPRDGAFFGHPDEGDLSGQIMMHSTFRDGAVPNNARFDSSFQGSESRSAFEAEAQYSRLTGSAIAINSLSEDGHKSNHSGEGDVKRHESTSVGTPRGNFSKNSPFEMGLRSVRQSTLPMTGQGFVKPMLPIELRSQAVPQRDTGKQERQSTDDAKKLLSEKGRVTLSKGQSDSLEFNEKDIIMTDDMPVRDELDGDEKDLKKGPTLMRKGEQMKLSMSKSKGRDYRMNAVYEKDEEVLLSESSEDSRSPRKRERIMNENSIEICTKNVTGHQDTDSDSPSKRRRVQQESVEDEKGDRGDGSFGKFIESSTLERASKGIDGTNISNDEGKVGSPQLSGSREGQKDRDKHR